MRDRSWLRLSVALVAMTALFIGCSDDDDDVIQPILDDARVRVAHLSPDAGLVDIWVDGSVALEDVDFRAVSEYLNLSPGSHRVQVSPANQTAPIVIDEQYDLQTGVSYTVAATGLVASIAASVFVDDVTTDGANAKIRFIHASPDAPPVTITLTDGTPLFSNIAFGQASPILPTPGGDYTLQVRVASTGDVVLTYAGIALSNDTNYTVVATGLLGDASLNAEVAVDAPGTGAGLTALTAATAEVRAAHLSPDAPNVDIYVDGALPAALTNVPFQAISGYLTLSAATHRIEVFQTGTSTGAVIDASVTLMPDTPYTVAATGLLSEGDLSPIVLEDWRQQPSAGKAAVRFVHASPDAPSVDVAVAGGPTLFDAVSFRGAEGYLEVDGGTYDIEVRLAGTTTVALPVNGLPLTSGSTYTIFAVGRTLDSSLSALQTADNAAQ